MDATRTFVEYKLQINRLEISHSLRFVSTLTEYLESVVNMMELWLKMLMSSGDLLTQDICGWYNYYSLVVIAFGQPPV